jgi:hypothetical protein
MLVNFDSLPETARIWIYQCNRSFTDIELEDKRFIVIALDQQINAATGCSIDASVKFIQELEAIYKVDLMDKMNVSYKQGDYVAYKSLIDFKKMAKDKAVSKNTIVFNNLVNSKAEYLECWVGLFKNELIQNPKMGVPQDFENTPILTLIVSF